MLPERKTTLNRVLDISLAMNKRAHEMDWDRLVQLEEERRPLLTAMFQPAPVADESTELASAIREIQRLDADTMSCGKVQLQQLTVDLQKLGSGQRAARAYGANER